MTAKHKYAVFVSGRGSNLRAMFEANKDGRLSYKPSLVVTDVAAAPALECARENGVETLFIDPSVHKGRRAFAERALPELRKRGIDTVCLAGFMRIVDKSLVEAFSGRMINIHPALLPAFPGLDAQKQALEAGAKESGCTVHFVDDGVDTGPTIMQVKVPVLEGDSVESLSSRILAQEHRIYPEVIQALMEDRIIVSGGTVKMSPPARSGPR
ncbi:MAG: phosphoribosylglycinamide formyltransferase [Nitrospinae bacterium]|nr:phosphoribosylglycinamide formyltransferase [Nitrospinota bacterium]